MRKEVFAFIMFTLGFLASFVGLKAIEKSSFFGGEGVLHVGKDDRPTDYGAPGSAYIVMDKESTENDTSIVLRDDGNARAEIGLVGNNDFRIKTVTGEYGSEEFTDRFLVRSTGEVDSVGKILRQFATTGTPRIAVGDSDGETSGSGLELSFNQDAGVGEVLSITRGISYRPLKISGSDIDFYIGERELGNDPVVSVSKDGIKTDGIVGVGTFQVDALPQPVSGGLILVSNASIGHPVLAFSDGKDWFRSDTLKAYPRPPKPVEVKPEDEGTMPDK